MADLTEIQASQSVKVAGAGTTTGIETNWMGVDANGNAQVIPTTAGAVAAGTAATNSNLIGAVFNTVLPTLTTGQQAAVQADSSGRLLIGGIASALPAGANVIGGVTQSGTWTVQQGTPPWLVAGNVASGASDSGNPVKIGGVFNTTQPTVTTGQRVDVQSTARGAIIAATGLDAFNITNITGTVVLPTGASTAANQATMITSLQLIDNPIGSVGAGTAGTSSFLIGGVFNTALPTLTTTQQAALQLDSSGRLIISPLTSSSTTTAAEDHNFGTVGANTLRAAAQIGNATGAADFAAGNSSAQTLRVVIATNQAVLTIQGDSASGAAKAGNPVQIGGVFNTTQPTVTTGQTVEAQSTARGALIVSTGVDNFNINNISGTVSLPTGAATSALQTTGNTSLSTIATALTLAQASTTSGQTGALTMAAVTTNPPAYTTAQTDPLSLTITGDLRSADIINTNGQFRAQSVTTSAAEALGAATILANRKSLTVTPTNGIVYWGYSNTVTTSSGTPIFKNQTSSWNIGANVHVYLIAGSTVDCRITEGS